MLAAPGLSSFAFRTDNLAADPTLTPGTSVVPGASNAEGSWTQIFAAVAQDCYWLYLQISSGRTASAIKDHLLDVGVDPAGGTSYSPVISNIVCGESVVTQGTGLAQAGHQFQFPIFIKAGSTVAVRIQGSNATAGTVRVAAKLWGQPTNPEIVPVGMYSETIGTIASSGGVGFTPGTTADGSWVSLGTTARDLWWWQLGVQVSNAAITALTTYVDLAFGDATNKIIMRRAQFLGVTDESITDLLTSNLNWLESYFPVPAGANLYVRGRCSAAPNTGWNAVAIGIGG